MEKKRKLNLINSKIKMMEKNWNERFILEKIPNYDAYKDINYLSLGLLRTKMRYEEKKLKENQKKSQKLRINSSNRIVNSKQKKFVHAPP